MAISWKLKTYLSQKHNLHKVTELQEKIREKTGAIISQQNLYNLMSTKPKMIRLRTMEFLCSAFECQLGDFCSVGPSDKKKPTQDRKLSHKNTPHAHRGANDFPEPEEYES
jgi:DNA-binding Xre family transcriptional regulator